jgi:adenine-specific DNA-methyltransferase
MFTNLKGNINLLDPGCGLGSLFVSVIEESLLRGNKNVINIRGFDIDESLNTELINTISLCHTRLNGACDIRISFKDFLLTDIEEKFSHIILNPPYKKISSDSKHRKYLKENIGVETGNLYSGFLAKAIKLTKKGGEIVAIIPRSFANGLYFKPFREFLLKETSIEKIHLFDERNSAFSEDSVLQENIIIHLVKGKKQGKVLITSSPSGDFHRDLETNTMTTDGLTQRVVKFEKVVYPNDIDRFIHIASSEFQQKIIDRLSGFTSTLKNINIQVSTGPVVDFRMKADLSMNPKSGYNPLIYPVHLKNGINWPIEGSKKPNAIKLSDKSKSSLWENKGFFLLTKRFSSKEEKRRIVATIYDSSPNGDLVGFENKLNVFHSNKKGLDYNLIKGLYVYLNSSLLDQYYRMFSGNTQVNATDLRALHYPNRLILEQIGEKIKSNSIDQNQIDHILNKVIESMSEEQSEKDPLNSQIKINEALVILKALGMPRAQQNERSALTLLALLNLKPNLSWSEIDSPMIGVTPIMDWVRDEYGKEYAPNSRETFRRQTLHQFLEAGFVAYNPDKPDRAPNSPKACYQAIPELKTLLNNVGNDKWDKLLKQFLSKRKTLRDKYAMKRNESKVPLTIDGKLFELTPGDHSILIKKIIEDFGPQFVPGSELIYVGDTENKTGYYQKDKLKKIGVNVNTKGKLPDVVLHFTKKNWLILIESVTSHGPVDGKRYNELKELFKDSTAELVYVTAFLTRKAMAKYIAEISWESEVWVAEAPTHMIHFNGHKFLGPYKAE